MEPRGELSGRRSSSKAPIPPPALLPGMLLVSLFTVCPAQGAYWGGKNS